MTTTVDLWPDTGLSKHGDPVFPHCCPLNQNLARVRTSGRGVLLHGPRHDMCQAVGTPLMPAAFHGLEALA